MSSEVKIHDLRAALALIDRATKEVETKLAAAGLDGYVGVYSSFDGPHPTVQITLRGGLKAFRNSNGRVDCTSGSCRWDQVDDQIQECVANLKAKKSRK